MRYAARMFDPRRLASFLCLVVIGARAQSAPQAGLQTAVEYSGYSEATLHAFGIYLTPVPNAPFSANQHVVTRQHTAAGNDRVMQTTCHIARTSSGMTYGEAHSMLPEASTAEPRLTEMQIYDPARMRNIWLYPQTHIARQIDYPRPRTLSTGPTSVSANPPLGVTETDLGESTISGIAVRGLKRVRTMAAAQSGLGHDIVITDEFWFAPSLSIYLRIKRADPRTGEQEITLTDIARTEPDSLRFRVPDDYKIVDETPPPPLKH